MLPADRKATVIDVQSNSAAKPPFFTRLGRLCVRYAAWILLFWVALAGVLNVAVPQLEQTVHKHSAPFIPGDLPGVDGLRAMAEEFGTPSSTAQGNVIVAAEGRIGPEQEQYYRALTAALEADEEHVAYVIDTFGKPAAREVGLSPDGKAINLLVAEVGDIGSTRAQSSTEAIRETIRSIPAPAGTTVEFTGTAPTLSDLFTAIDSSLLVITAVSVVLIMALVLVFITLSALGEERYRAMPLVGPAIRMQADPDAWPLPFLSDVSVVALMASAPPFLLTAAAGLLAAIVWRITHGPPQD